MEKPKKLLLSETIPSDLLISIFSTLPAKSIARFRCVSKEWASILRRRDFTDLHLKMSLARRSLLFTFKLNGKLRFFSAPQPLNPDQVSSPVVADCYMSFHTEDCAYRISEPVCSLLCSSDTKPMVFNPSTGNYVTLPKVTARFTAITFLGYDPINKLFKVLRVSNDYKVLTLGNGEPSWRLIQGPIMPLYVVPGGICIDGILYYIAKWQCSRTGSQFSNIGLFGFDVRSEDFKFVTRGSMVTLGTTLMNFKGKLGAIVLEPFTFYTKSTTDLELWVLHDAETHRWSRHILELPPSWKNLVRNVFLYIAGMTRTGEIVFSPSHNLDLHDVPFYIFYYNVARNTVARVEIQLGMVVPEGCKIRTFIDHVEDLLEKCKSVKSCFWKCLRVHRSL